MPALVCPEDLVKKANCHPAVTTVEISNLKRKNHLQQQQQDRQHYHYQRFRSIFDLPEVCDLIAGHLDKNTLTVVVRVCRLWYANWIRHLWRRIRVEAGTLNGIEMVNAFPRLSLYIRQLEWIHSSDPTSAKAPIASELLMSSTDLSKLNLHSLLLNGGAGELDETTLTYIIQSSIEGLSALQLHNIRDVRGDLLKAAGVLVNLRHFSLAMADQDDDVHPHHRCLQQYSGVSTSTSSLSPPSSSSSSSGSIISPLTSAMLFHELSESELDSASPSQSSPNDSRNIEEYTTADELPTLMNACPYLRTIQTINLSVPLTREADATLDSGYTSDASEDGSIETGTETVPELEAIVDVKKATVDYIPQQWTIMQHLTDINLHGTAVSGNTLSVLFARSPHLIKLNLGQTASPLYLTGFHLEPTLIMTAMSSLVLSKCHFLDGQAFKEIFKASPNLLTLDISDTNIDDATLGALGHQCFKLMELDMQGCRQITDQGVRDMLSYPPSTESNEVLAPYQNYSLCSLSIVNCTELTGQGVRHVLMTCARLKDLEAQQPELLPESLFPHGLETNDEEELHNSLSEVDAVDDVSSLPWACYSTLETLRIKSLNFLNLRQARFLNARLSELKQLKVLHIGGSQLELSVLSGLGNQLESLFVDELTREVNLDDVRWLVDHTPNLTRLWCRQLIRHSEPWKLLRETRKNLKLW
ncbi:hypothetical protein BX616_006768 [Lobosporangium transversale]|uniref:F-box/LRR-repeat protein 15-like leucin rich repeat domain-containing protein n=1 Tax=Lobosporangium transversale TaxID=64571 RepID=A0A1Y2GF45_9FUNG|nr:hypothetical protein BCR41DRAFT_358855 [Lobosporangium transversale]KAF9915165.1 hypothetical protein BX616_006768 [Lobosporangium transversale]ORZ09085.1 hypothetical protein BCR41DRAFT_358855 [Lobosporangium transversale]|eukprot:XP_021878712.1 hypothetical protein BCR41DRAFT_358855 [Lobosporangium transversale]